MDPVGSLRQEYGRSELTEKSVSTDPVEQFRRWFEEARAADIAEPNAMALSTVGPDGRPSSRMVLLKGFDRGGFTFFTNYESRKAVDLAVTPQASLLFWWQPLERQIRIEGVVERVDGQRADEYFRSRPRNSQISAWVSPQSRPLASREDLETRRTEFEERFPGEIPRPEHWGGFRLIPDCFEFWQGRSGRLHDRIRFTGGAARWRIDRLAP